jgi:hypothetical protein
LRGAGSGDRPIRFVKRHTGVIPFKVAKIQQCFGLPGLINDQFFIPDVVNKARENVVPVIHQFTVMAVIPAHIAEVVGIVMLLSEIGFGNR